MALFRELLVSWTVCFFIHLPIYLNITLKNRGTILCWAVFLLQMQRRTRGLRELLADNVEVWSRMVKRGASVITR